MPPNLFLDKDAQLVEKRKEGRDEEASHKDMMQIGKDGNFNQNGEEVENDQIVPFFGLTVFDDLFLQALILLDELVQTEIKLAANGDEIPNIRDSFSTFPAGNGRAGNLESFC